MSKRFGDLEVLKDINLTVEPGEVVCIIGPSGAGKSTFLRSLNQLEKITSGKGELSDIDDLYALASAIKNSALCGLGQTAPNPVLSTLRYFKDEYIAHVVDKKCPAGVCKNLLQYKIVADKCRGCSLCSKKCPVGCISGEIKKPFVIDQSKCIKCGTCMDTCKFGAIVKE